MIVYNVEAWLSYDLYKNACLISRSAKRGHHPASPFKSENEIKVRDVIEIKFSNWHLLSEKEKMKIPLKGYIVAEIDSNSNPATLYVYHSPYKL